MGESKDTNFDYFISMTLRKKIPWSMLLVFLDDLTPTLVKSKQAIEILVKHLQCLHTKLQDKAIDGENLDVEIIDPSEKSEGQKSIDINDSHDPDEPLANVEFEEANVINDGDETDTILPEIIFLVSP